MPTPPVLHDVYLARARLAGVLPRTPLRPHPLLSEALGCNVFVKHENHLPTGAFKVRGGLNLVAAGKEAGERRPIVTASTGNHGQSIAYACRRFGVRCRVFVPRGNNPEKNAAMRAWGAEVIEHGRDFDEAREEVERVAAAGDVRYVHSANEPLLVAGVATCALEVFEELPEVDAVFVPIGGGSGAAGQVLVRDALGAPARIVGVQAAGADAFTRAWRSGRPVSADTMHTFAEGIATRVTFEMTFDMLSKRLDDVVLLSEDQLAEGVRLALRTTHNLAEGAGAASIAAARAYADRLAGRTIVCIMSGGNIDRTTLATILAGRTPERSTSSPDTPAV
ncbi:MAG TPA: threonine dehydratase [Vicinamibacterales bacterium]